MYWCINYQVKKISIGLVPTRQTIIHTHSTAFLNFCPEATQHIVCVNDN